MPKRKLDEVDSLFSPMQMKTQVGPKHLADPKFMKEIYDRTLSLLRAGATKQFDMDTDLEKISSALQTPNPSRESSPPSRCLSPLPPDGSVTGMETPMMCSSGENSPLKIVGDFSAMIQEETPTCSMAQQQRQLCIDPRGKLTKSSMQHSTTSSSNRCCAKSPIAPTNQCSFCEKGLCQNCFRICVSCRHYFCSVCSLLEYRETGEETVCLTCQCGEMM